MHSMKNLIKPVLFFLLLIGFLPLDAQQAPAQPSQVQEVRGEFGRIKAPEEYTPSELFRTEQFDPTGRPSITTQAVVLAGLALMPFVIMLLTSFIKIVIVISLLRSALGVQQAPPNQVINGIALMLSIYVMYPTILKMYDASQSVIDSQEAPTEILSTQTSAYFLAVADKAKEPLRDFLKRNSSASAQGLFFKMAFKALPQEYRSTIKPDQFIILVPAYIVSQLKEAFQIGVLIYIPFFVIDLVTSNILLAMGMMMLSPVTISMPLKLFLLVMLDGWTLLVEGLVNSFR